MKDFWNKRYMEKEYAYGTEANRFLQLAIQNLKLKGAMLFPLEGEGRNAVFAAQSGLEVTAFDYSEEAQKKALDLADKNGVSFSYLNADINSIDFEENSFDSVALIYAHFPPHQRRIYHQKLAKYIKPGGMIILEGFSKNNLEISKNNESSSGPQNIEMLFSKDDISKDFEGFEIMELSEEIVDLHEGAYHKGLCSVIQFVARKN